MIPIVKDLEKVCPQALVLNFTNPKNRICLAISKLTKLHALGICHGTQGTCEVASKIMGKNPDDLEFLIGGITTFTRYWESKDTTTGMDMMSVVGQAIAEDETVNPATGKISPSNFRFSDLPLRQPYW